MFFFGFSNNRVISIFMLISILVLSLFMSAYLPVLEGLENDASGATKSDAPVTGAPVTGETDLNKIIATINAQSQIPTGTTEKQAVAGIVLNDKYTEQTISAAALKDLLKNSDQVQAIMNPTLPPTPIQ
jgi:hypothetical protein